MRPKLALCGYVTHNIDVTGVNMFVWLSVHCIGSYLHSIILFRITNSFANRDRGFDLLTIGLKPDCF